MRLLLDTHIWIWSVLEPQRLSPGLSQILGCHDHEKWLSPVSAWELGLLIEKGRFRSPWSAAAWIEKARQQVGWREAPFTYDVAFQAIATPLSWRDPADRLLVATARWYGLTLVTADRKLLAANACALLPNR